MPKWSLTLIPYRKSPLTIRLLENDERQSSVERILESIDNENHVYSDLTYDFKLECDAPIQVQDAEVFINDAFEKSEYVDGNIYFVDSKWIFQDCYGFVELKLTLFLDDGSCLHLVSNYLPVLVKQGKLNDCVKEMVGYVSRHQEELLMNGESKARDFSEFKENGYKTLSAQITLAQEIATIYEQSYGYFKANSRFKVEKVPTVDYLEKLRDISPTTLQYIASHPEQLRRVSSTSGVRIGNHVYQPQKTMFMKSNYSLDIYENRVIFGFLHRMVDNVLDLHKRCDALLHQIPDKKEYSSDYIYSSFFMVAETRNALEAAKHQLTDLHNKFTQLLGMYRDIFSFKVDMLNVIPQCTPVFMSIPEYHKLFVRIRQWFTYGIYDYAKEKFMLSFIKISSLYESYLLAKMISYLKEHGYTLTAANKFPYPTYRGMKYKNTSCNNTFVFCGENSTLTLYFQPVIFNPNNGLQNKIGVYRNNSIPINIGEDDDDPATGAPYYCPDYLIKHEGKHGTKYIIADAKFSDYTQMKKERIEQLTKLVFKYLFSLSPLDNTDKIIGLCIFYGKFVQSKSARSVYNWEHPNSSIAPFAELVPIIEGIDTDKHFDKLDYLFSRLYR